MIMKLEETVARAIDEWHDPRNHIEDEIEFLCGVVDGRVDDTTHAEIRDEIMRQLPK